MRPQFRLTCEADAAALARLGVCDGCGAAPVAFVPGDEGEQFLGTWLRRPVADRRFCIDCARATGWPWISSERAA